MTKNVLLDDDRLINRASILAAQVHQHQMRKDGKTPYISHVHRVCLLVVKIDQRADAETLAAALLHDTIEDTKVDFDEVAEATTERVAHIVVELTKDMRLAGTERDREYHENILKSSHAAKMIKLADLYDNASDGMWSDHFSVEKQRKTCRENYEFARAIIETLSDDIKNGDGVRGLMQRFEMLLTRCGA
jgi:guanosine-3',5'-bis(diphosphate) 3'-pyrophosphohydrolase